MGLTNWAGGRPRKADVSVAKNYLSVEELHALNLIVAAYLDFAELQAVSRRPMTMTDWIAKLDDFIRLSDREVLAHAGTVSHDAARLKAEAELARFRAAQDAFPQPVDRHFDASIEEIKRIESQVKKTKPGRKKRGGGE